MVTSGCAAINEAYVTPMLSIIDDIKRVTRKSEVELASAERAQQWILRHEVKHSIPSQPGTSMLAASDSQGGRDHEDLPALSTASSRNSSSIPSSIGVRASESQQQMLEEGRGGVLTVPPLSGRRILECPFNDVFSCKLTFSNEDDWMRHSLTHFINQGRAIEPPTSNRCCFCDKEFYSSRPFQSWGERMRHVWLHHCLGHRLAHARPDLQLFEFLFNKRLISDSDYRELKANCRGSLAVELPRAEAPFSGANEMRMQWSQSPSRS